MNTFRRRTVQNKDKRSEIACSDKGTLYISPTTKNLKHATAQITETQYNYL